MEHGAHWASVPCFPSTARCWEAVGGFLYTNVAMIATYVLSILLVCINIPNLHNSSMSWLHHLRLTDEAQVGKVTCHSHTARKLLRWHLIPGRLIPEPECLTHCSPALAHSKYPTPLCTLVRRKIVLQEDYSDILSNELYIGVTVSPHPHQQQV